MLLKSVVNRKQRNGCPETFDINPEFAHRDHKNGRRAASTPRRFVRQYEMKEKTTRKDSTIINTLNIFMSH